MGSSPDSGYTIDMAATRNVQCDGCGTTFTTTRKRVWARAYCSPQCKVQHGPWSFPASRAEESTKVLAKPVKEAPLDTP